MTNHQSMFAAFLKNIAEWLYKQGVYHDTPLGKMMLAVAMILSMLVVYLFLRHFFLKILTHVIERTRLPWANAFLESGIFKWVGYFSFPFIAVLFIPIIFFENAEDIETAFLFNYGFGVYIFCRIMVSFMMSLEIIYNNIRPLVPIRGIVRLFKYLVYSIGLIVVISNVFETSPVTILSSLGAATAILVLIFKDAITGFITSIQITSNNLARIGDWVELPNADIEGIIQEITLTTVKIKGFDRILYTLPVTDITTKTFKNLQPIVEEKARRVFHSVRIDYTSVRFMNDEEIAFYQTQPFFTHVKHSSETPLTNLELFRAHIHYYLANHPLTNTSLFISVYLDSANEKGIPMKFIAFCKEFSLNEYKNYLSQIIEYITVTSKLFGIKLYQDQVMP